MAGSEREIPNTSKGQCLAKVLLNLPLTEEEQTPHDNGGASVVGGNFWTFIRLLETIQHESPGMLSDTFISLHVIINSLILLAKLNNCCKRSIGKPEVTVPPTHTLLKTAKI